MHPDLLLAYEMNGQPFSAPPRPAAAPEAGAEQPLQAVWNLGGYGDNAVQRLSSALRFTVGQAGPIRP